jgi:hypothetical protein
MAANQFSIDTVSVIGEAAANPLGGYFVSLENAGPSHAYCPGY